MPRNDAVIIAHMRLALAERKTVIIPSAWRNGNRPTKLILPLACNCSLVGVFLHITAQQNRPDEDVSFMLCLDDPDETWPIARVDWKPSRPHTNSVPGPHFGLMTEESGLHPLEANLDHGLTVMKARNLPVCVPILPEPPDWPAALACVRDTLAVTNIEGLPTPPWSQTLF